MRRPSRVRTRYSDQASTCSPSSHLPRSSAIVLASASETSPVATLISLGCTPRRCSSFANRGPSASIRFFVQPSTHPPSSSATTYAPASAHASPSPPPSTPHPPELQASQSLKAAAATPPAKTAFPRPPSAQRPIEKRQAHVHPVIDIRMIIIEFLIPMLDPGLRKPPRQYPRAVVDVILVPPPAIDVDPPQ